MTSPFSSEVRKLYHAGYSPVPDAPSSKRPLIEGWSRLCTERASKMELKKWMEKDNLNVSVALGPASGIVALDFDEDTHGLHDKILAMLPDSPVQKMGSRGKTLFFRYNGETNRTWKSNKKVVLELLSIGRKTTMPPSVHPSGMAYKYLTEKTLTDVKAEELPVLPEGFVLAVDKLLGIERGDSYLVATIEEIRAALEYISPDDYDTWTQVGMAINSAYPGDEGFELWNTWSQQSTKYQPSGMRQKWLSFKRGGISIGTLFFLASQEGYECRFTEQELRDDVMRYFITLDQVEDEIDQWRVGGKVVGVDCGIPGLASLLHFRPGELTLIGGYANAGKSEFVDSIIMGLMQSDARWKGALCSMEKGPHSHYDNLIQKYTGQPRAKVSVDKYREAKAFLRDQIVMVDGSSMRRRFDSILVQLERYLKFNDLNFVVFDPFNYLQTSLKSKDPLMHLQVILTDLADFAKQHSLHALMVAHPTKPPTSFDSRSGKQKDDGSTALPKLTQYSFSGGADFANISDNIIAVHRRPDETVDIDVLKVRDQEVDRCGGLLLNFDRGSRRYSRVTMF